MERTDKNKLEQQRLAALASYHVLDTPPEQSFDELADLAALLCEAPISLITLVDENRQWFKSRIGLDLEETSRTVSFCAHAIQQPGIFIVRDATQDPRFASNPLVLQDPNIRFYAGAPLVTPDGYALGTLCIIDREPRELKPSHEQALNVLSHHVMTLLESRRQKHEIDRLSALLTTDGSNGGEVDHLREEILRHERIEHSLRRERNLSEQIVNNMPGVFYLFDSELRYLRWNRNLEIATGYTADELTSLTPLDLFSGAERERVTQRIAIVFETGSSEVEAKLLHKDGSETPYYFTGCQIQYDGRPCLIGMGIDISEYKALEAQLLQVQKLDSIGRLAAGIAHDFNNLLTVQHGYLSMAAEDPALPRTLHEAIQQSLVATEKAAALTRQLLVFSRRQVIQIEAVELNQIVDNLSRMLRRILGEDVHLHLSLAENPLPLDADAGMIEQVIMNLVVNARDAMPDGGRLEIRTYSATLSANDTQLDPRAQPGSFAVLEVQDTGHGIPDDVIDQIFEPFYTTKEPGQGTGLGLATVYGIVQQHQGWIRVWSDEQRGTRFRVFLPIRTATHPEEARPQPSATVGGGQETILLVEDDAQVREVGMALLRSYGYNVITAVDGLQALSLWDEHEDKIDLLMTDMVMPGQLNGLELITRLRERRPDLKAILVSGYQPELVQEVKLSPITKFMQKPYRKAELAQALRSLLDKTAQR
jgi:two-component system, cell cycle sensor histidine kinase and response regulator CckA